VQVAHVLMMRRAKLFASTVISDLATADAAATAAVQMQDDTSTAAAFLDKSSCL